ncbi:MAG: hypothetical protein ABUL62_02305 [Myxococcales bacterium]
MDKKAEREAMIDETLVQTYPASDSPSWTLGVEDAEAAVAPSKVSTYLRRNAVLELLSDDEVARVSTAETATQLAEGEEYLDLARPERGALRASAPATVNMSEVLPRSVVSEQTWERLILAVHQGWAKPEH